MYHKKQENSKKPSGFVCCCEDINVLKKTLFIYVTYKKFKALKTHLFACMHIHICRWHKNIIRTLLFLLNNDIFAQL